MNSGTDRPGARHGRRLIAAALVTLALAAAAAAAPYASAREVLSDALARRLAFAGPAEHLPILVTLSRQVDPDGYDDRPEDLLRALRRTASATQDAVADDLDQPVRHFWLVNAVSSSATPAEIAELEAEPAVANIDLDRTVGIAAAGDPAPSPAPGAGDWGLGAIGAPSVWSGYGLTGAGVRVGSIDTGVDPQSPELAGKIVAWHDFVANRSTPYDDNGHGTHTIGTMVGGAVGGAPIGVAPGAQVVVAKALGASGGAPGSALIAAAQWMTDPDGNPATADYPAVVNNSWYAQDANDTWFRPLVRQWVALGIVPVFAAGNGGAGAGTVGSPASYPESLAVGAEDRTGALADFSSRGPVVWDNRDGDGPAAGTQLLKPDLVAPGVDIVSAVPGGYLSYSGTSMAAPHVAGVVALVKQAHPELGAAQIEDLLRRTAQDLGPPGPDMGFGAGLVNSLAALGAVSGPPTGPVAALTPPGSAPAAKARTARPARIRSPRVTRRRRPAAHPARVRRGKVWPARRTARARAGKRITDRRPAPIRAAAVAGRMM